jgi:hypothetical protein
MKAEVGGCAVAKKVTNRTSPLTLPRMAGRSERFDLRLREE